MRIAGLSKLTTIDFPSRLACILFTAGCNYDCGFCHNRSLLYTDTLLDEDEVWSFLRKRAGQLEGVVISGGEPTLQWDLEDAARRIRSLGYAVKLDTNGSNPETLERLLSAELLDYVAMDYKAPFRRYLEICGKDAAGVEESLALLFGSGVPFELRTTVIPELKAGDMVEMAGAVPVLPRYYLQLFRSVPGYERATLYKRDDLASFREMILPAQPNAQLRF